jgi:hypothetical protein
MQAHFTHRDKIDDQPRDRLGFQNRILDKQTEKMTYLTRCDARISRKTKKRENGQSREQDRLFSSFSVIKIFLYRLTDPILSVERRVNQKPMNVTCTMLERNFLPSMRWVSKYATLRNIFTTLIAPKVYSASLLLRPSTTLVANSRSNSVAFNECY